MKFDRFSDVILRAGLAFAFLYPPINAVFDPISWIGYLPHFVRGFVPDIVVLHSFGLLEVAIALWILSGKRILLPCIMAATILAVIVVLNLQDFQIIFRDVAIAAIAVALAVKAYSVSVPRIS